MIPASLELNTLAARMQAAARAVRLPLRNQAWRGMHGSFSGTGTGSSIDFQDHRPYFPGDDPRHIDWQAYARSGHYSMKLYREEVSPGIDLALDISESMFLDTAKAERTLELFYFAAASALQVRSLLRCYLVAGSTITPLAAEAVFSGETLASACENAPRGTVAPALDRIPWRTGSLRLWISDLLYPGEPATGALAMGRGRGVIFAPWSRAELEPAWEGNVELIDCESDERRRQRVDAGLLARYREAYARHFQLWREHARRSGVAFARVPAGPDFLEALSEEALPNGAVEPA
jgi:uncharacterized protein (DUF58 family)